MPFRSCISVSTQEPKPCRLHCHSLGGGWAWRGPRGRRKPIANRRKACPRSLTRHERLCPTVTEPTARKLIYLVTLLMTRGIHTERAMLSRALLRAWTWCTSMCLYVSGMCTWVVNGHLIILMCDYIYSGNPIIPIIALLLKRVHLGNCSNVLFSLHCNTFFFHRPIMCSFVHDFGYL